MDRYLEMFGGNSTERFHASLQAMSFFPRQVTVNRLSKRYFCSHIENSPLLTFFICIFSGKVTKYMTLFLELTFIQICPQIRIL